MGRFLFSLILAMATFATGATEPFIGTLRNTRGKPVKGVKVFLHTPKDAVKHRSMGRCS